MCSTPRLDRRSQETWAADVAPIGSSPPPPPPSPVPLSPPGDTRFQHWTLPRDFESIAPRFHVTAADRQRQQPEGPAEADGGLEEPHVASNGTNGTRAAVEPHPHYGKAVPAPLWEPPPAPPPRAFKGEMEDNPTFNPTVGKVAALSAAGLALLVGCLCLLGATANHSTPQRYRRKGTIREHDAGGDDAFGYR